MKRILFLVLVMMLMVSLPVSAASPKPKAFRNALYTQANILEAKHYKYGNPGPKSYKNLKNYSHKTYSGTANCVNYVKWSLQRSRYLTTNGIFRVTEGKGLESSISSKRLKVIYNHKGNKYECNAVYSDGSARGELGEYPTLRWLMRNGSLKKGDIIFQWDNPDNISEYTGRCQTKADGFSGTQGHVEVYMGMKRTGEPIIYSVGGGYWSHKAVVVKNHMKNIFSSDGIRSAEYDTRNRHHDPHVSYIIRLK